jgi:hypothetical protein
MIGLGGVAEGCCLKALEVVEGLLVVGGGLQIAGLRDGGWCGVGRVGCWHAGENGGGGQQVAGNGGVA